ncbi:MAG: hypothetical protein GY900_03945, partial [Actinomycetia bacterium]|nr:hypothetical protein [Actinomycetes bacterium]
MEESVRLAVLADAEVLGCLAAGARAELPDKKGGDVVQRLDPHRVDPGARVMAAVEDPDATVL